MLADKIPMLRPSTLTGIGDFVAWYRAKRDLSMKDLGEQLGVTRNYIHLVEHDEYLLPHSFIKSISDILTKEEHDIMVEAVLKAVKASIE